MTGKNKIDQVKWSKVDSFVGNSSSSALTYYRPCPICGSIKSKNVLEFKEFQFYTDSANMPKRADVRENICLDCFTIYLNPCYSTYGFQTLFEEAGQSYGSTEGRPQEQTEWLDDRGRLEIGMSILDVGCYEGVFLAHLPKGMHKMGVDIDRPAIERARARNRNEDMKFFLGDFETFQYSVAPPDTITMFHVLEHLPRPTGVLKKLLSISKPDTNLVVEVPILENGFTNDINGFLSVQHMTHFSRKSLANSLELSGWELIEQIEQEDYNGCRVLAKPASVLSEARLEVVPDPDDLVTVSHYLENWYRALTSVEKVLKNINSEKRVVIWGGGAHTEFLYQATSFFQRHRDCEFLIVDSDPLKQEKTWRGIEIFDPTILSGLDWAQMSLVISSYGGQESIARLAGQIGVPEARIIRLYRMVSRY